MVLPVYNLIQITANKLHAEREVLALMTHKVIRK